MTLINYFIENIELNKKLQKVRINFKRIPTQDELNIYEAKMKRPDEKFCQCGQKHPHPSNIMSTMGMILQCPEPEAGINLPWESVLFILSIKEVYDLNLKIGQKVELNIPECTKDILIIKEEEIKFE